eukprot:TRINITY_DN2617_c0_g1_i1.p1 TRINITY_DN2617_c0_g1~~TRINITY_DN2617_c0_g1_i1.p1  ORF type:complete len:536 (+),score=157.09 TRINITY_DN2617_c0_g1_i1:68-1609(+)
MLRFVESSSCGVTHMPRLMSWAVSSNTTVTASSLSFLANHHNNSIALLRKTFFSTTSASASVSPTSTTKTIEGKSEVPSAFLDYLAPRSQRSNKPNVLIKGNGVGAITLALALQKRHMQVTLLDKNVRFRAADPGIFLPINASFLLNSLGLGKRLDSHAHIIANKIITDENGVTKHKLDLEIGKGKGQHNLSIDSNALLSTMVSKAKAVGVDVLPGVSPVSWIRCDDGRIQVHFNNDRVPLKYDVVVAADGIDSKIRKKEFAKESRVLSPKAVCYRAVIDREHTSVPLDSIIEMRGKGVTLVLNPYSATKVLVSLYEAEERAPYLVNAEGDREVTELTEKIVKHFQGPFLSSVIGRLNVQEKCKLIVPQQLTSFNWVNGRVVLLGSAAHTMYPYYEQNDALEIEDAFSLAANLDKHENIDTALSNYFTQRASRVSAIQLRAQDHFENLLTKGEEERPKGRVRQFFASVKEKIPMKNPLAGRRSRKEYEQLKQTWADLVFQSGDLAQQKNTSSA